MFSRIPGIKNDNNGRKEVEIKGKFPKILKTGKPLKRCNLFSSYFKDFIY